MLVEERNHITTTKLQLGLLKGRYHNRTEKTAIACECCRLLKVRTFVCPDNCVKQNLDECLSHKKSSCSSRLKIYFRPIDPSS